MLESLFNKVAGLKSCNSVKKRPQHRCFPVKFAKFLRTSFLQNSSNSSSDCFWGLTLVFKEVRNKTGATVSNKYLIQLEKRICYGENQHLSDKFTEGRYFDSHKKRKEYGQYCWYFRLNLKYLAKTPKNGKFCEELLSENDFEAVLATFCCYDHGTKASEAIQKIATVQKEYRKCISSVIICWIA